MSDLIERLHRYAKRAAYADERDVYQQAAAELARLTAEVERLRADAESWRKYKARKDAVIAAGMGRNPLRDAAIKEAGNG